MKTNFIDRVIGYINPERGLKRMQNRMAMDRVRSYDAATTGRRRGNLNRRVKGAAAEASRNADALAGVSQGLVRNNPLAQRIKQIWASNTVGDGIRVEIEGRNDRVVDDFTNYFEGWSTTTACDFDGINNFSGLIHLAIATMVETGGALIRFDINNALRYPLRLQIIEQTYLDKTRDRNSLNGDALILDGIQYTENGEIDGYWVNIDRTGTDQQGVSNSRFYRRGRDMIHVFKRERTGQHIGISWLAQVATLLDKYNTLQDAKVMQQQVAACLGVIVQNAETGLGVGKSDEDDRVDLLEPATINYVGAGTTVTTVTPPRADDGSAFITELKNDIASGVGLNYQQLTGDYSRFNFASGRMGKIEFNLMLDTIQQLVLLPHLQSIMSLLFDIYQLQASVNTRIDATWVFPPRAAVDPASELDVAIKKARAGLATPQLTMRMFGTRLDTVVQGWERFYTAVGNLAFDIRPDQFSAAGNQLDNNDAASNNSPSQSNENTTEDS